LYQAIMATVARVPEWPAFEFLGRSTSYREFGRLIDRCSDALRSVGLRQGDRLAIALPTSPQGVIAFYAANRLGVVPAMIHPLAAPAEIESYLNASQSRVAVTLDALYRSFAEVRSRTRLQTIILARICDDFGPLKRLGYWVTRGRKIPRVPRDPDVRWWSELMDGSCAPAPAAGITGHDPAAILFSGGTTGTPKGIALSSRNLICEGLQVAAWVGMHEGESILAILPLFHGAGLGLGINAALLSGCKSIMVPMFSAAIVARLMASRRPTLMVGVPTLYDALTREPAMARANLSCLRAAFAGADTLPRTVEERFEKLIADSGGHLRLLEGYGLTEAVTAIMASPLDHYREGSIGVSFPDMLATICHPGRTEPVAPGQEGEICVSGPAVMLGYLDDPEATAGALRTHEDGRVWLHTGDLGRMDEEGFFYFTCRLKRMIKSSGFNVYPAQVESVLCRHPAVSQACVIGVPDEAQVERVKAVRGPQGPGGCGTGHGHRADRPLPPASHQVGVPA
jgi:long-chain acyl-CoA synthetase